jgi:hypothetical protein
MYITANHFFLVPLCVAIVSYICAVYWKNEKQKKILRIISLYGLVLSTLDFWFSLGVLLYWALKYFFGDLKSDHQTLPNKWFLVVAAVSTGFFSFIWQPYYGSAEPGAFFERDTYKRMFFVILVHPRDKQAEYRVPALISARMTDVETNKDYYIKYKKYFIEYAVMPNRGKIVFDDNIDWLDGLIVDKQVTVDDHEGRSWLVTLTRDPA